MTDTYNGGYTKALLDVLVNNRAELRNTGTVKLRYDRALGEFLNDKD